MDHIRISIQFSFKAHEGAHGCTNRYKQYVGTGATISLLQNA